MIRNLLFSIWGILISLCIYATIPPKTVVKYIHSNCISIQDTIDFYPRVMYKVDSLNNVCYMKVSCPDD